MMNFREEIAKDMADGDFVIYQTMYNSDMTEGRGPMVAGPAFYHKTHANEYIDAQPGVMGRKVKWSEQEYGDWIVREVHVHKVSLVAAKALLAQAKEAALAKLTPDERAILGL